MSSFNNGGPAFPVPLNPGEPWRGMGQCDGMTLRDYFAAKIIGGMMADPTCRSEGEGWGNFCEAMAEQAYDLSDAMLAAREKGGAA